MDEFALIRRYFAPLSHTNADVALGIGDDCALLNLRPGEQMAVSIDTAVAGVHFPADAAPALIAQRSLRCALSDLAAAGAEPLGFTLALTLPTINETWLAQFAQGLAADSQHFACPLIGGDTTRGPLTLSIQVHGRIPSGQMLTRAGAQVGDKVLVSGDLGGARAALDELAKEDANPELLARYWHPEPRLALGEALRGLANAAIDISDGLLADLGHIAVASEVAIHLHVEAVPRAKALLASTAPATSLDYALTGGDDYELALCVPTDRLSETLASAEALGCKLTAIGEVHAGAGVHCLDQVGQRYQPSTQGYQHFGDVS